jgi:carbon-monoxide dehydrogenase large subunit
MATARLLGASIKRREDPRFITGKGNYTDDLKLAGMTHAAFVRSPHANAKIRKIDTSKASKAPGVVAIFTGKDMTGVNSLPCGWLLPELKIPAHMPLASDAARYVGDPVAIVIAESQSAASDAADLVAVDWEVLPSVTATEQATAKGSVQIHEVAPDNVAFKWQIGDAAATDAAFKSAAVTVKKRIVNQRLVANPMEPRACVARYEDATGEWTLWVTSQNPHVHRQRLPSSWWRITSSVGLG